MASQPRTIEQPSYFRVGSNEESSAIAKGLIVKAGTAADGILIATAATSALLGVTVEPIAPGKSQSYQVGGKAAVLSGAAITVGQVLTSDAAGKAVPLTASASSTARILGTAKTAAGGADEWVEVELQIGAVAFIGSSTVADRAALKALTAAQRFAGQLVVVQDDGSLWRFDGASTLTDDEAQELVVEPAAGTGAWLRADKAFVMKIPIAYTNTDAEAILTVPAGFALRLTGHSYWEITTAFSGGSASTIGISTDIASYDTKGDILGGAAGDSTAVETTGIKAGTQGAELDDNVGFHAILMAPGKKFRFDRITSAYTEGEGFVRIPVAVATAP
jgi:hypothetical protein